MNPEDLKKGEKYKLELTCIYKADTVIVFETPTGDHIPLRCSDIECVSPAPAPKYDPCRLFKKGDKVKVKKQNGRGNGKDGEYLLNLKHWLLYHVWSIELWLEKGYRTRTERERSNRDWRQLLEIVLTLPHETY